MVELGCGSAAKTSILLDALLARDGPARVRFAGIDVSGSFLAAAKQSLLASCAGLCAPNVELICAEYIEGALTALLAQTPSLIPSWSTATDPVGFLCIAANNGPADHCGARC